MTARARIAWLAALALTLGAAACGETGTDEAPGQDAPRGETITRKSELGPVTATVTVSPARPTLVDPITLTLEVEAEPGVNVEMPPFNEALGRFLILGFVPREEQQDGRRRATQTYTLQAPMSGKQRIPPLRVDFVDERPGRAGAGADEDATAGAAGQPGAQELLTDEISLDVISILPEGAVVSELRALREPLDPRGRRSRAWRFWLALAVLAGSLAIGAVRMLRARALLRRRESAYDVAMARLLRLESRGLPAPTQADDWYVELSGIIRRYLEDRYSLRAPELTTEEFLQVTRRSGVLSSEHRELLSNFLIGCDRVKFARYAPDDEESSLALTSARRFLEETRLEDTPQPAAPQAAQSAETQTAQSAEAEPQHAQSAEPQTAEAAPQHAQTAETQPEKRTDAPGGDA